jgi:hypothetical protein
MFDFIKKFRIMRIANTATIEPSHNQGVPTAILVITKRYKYDVVDLLSEDYMYLFFINEIEIRINNRDIGCKELMARADMPDYYKNMQGLENIPRLFIDANANEIFRWDPSE